MKNEFYFIVLLFLLVACKSPKVDFSKVVFEAEACFGTCPIFNMVITDDGNAVYEAKQFNSIQGIYKTVVRKVNLDTLNQMLGKVNIFSLPDKYQSALTDLPTYTMTVEFKNGQSKKIINYGPLGPESLQQLYGYLFSLRGSQNWK